jgi:sugar lactone lactonase YvrE
MMRSLILTAAVLALGAASPAEAGYKARVLVPAGPFHGVHGLAFGPDGYLYAGDIMGSNMHRINVSTGSHRVAVAAPLGMADDVAFAPAGTPFAGTMVWTGVGVGKLYAQSPGGQPRLIAENLPSINSVGFAPDGKLYATQTGPTNKTLWRVDLDGKQPPEKLWDNTGGLNGFVIAADGFLYGPQADLGTVIRLNLETREITPIAEGFAWPTAVEMDARGLLYVLDFNAGTVTQLNKDTDQKTLLATLEPGIDNMAMGPADGPTADKLYVSSIGRNGIFEIDLNTKAMRTVVAGLLTAPGGVAVLGTGEATRVYVADMFTLREINPANGDVKNVMAIDGAGSYPATVNKGTLDERDVLITSGWYTGRVQVIDPKDGAVLREEKNFAAPHDVVMAPDGALLVAETGAKKITRVSTDGIREAFAEGFKAPVGLALTPDTLYVTDAEAGSVTAVNLTTRDMRIVAKNLRQPEGIAVLADGRLAVVEVGAKAVRAITIASGKIDDIATKADVGLVAPEPLPKTWIFNGIAQGPDGALYLPSDMQAGVFVFITSDGPTSTLGALRRLTSGMFR